MKVDGFKIGMRVEDNMGLSAFNKGEGVVTGFSKNFHRQNNIIVKWDNHESSHVAAQNLERIIPGGGE
jgi:hypothetical protein